MPSWDVPIFAGQCRGIHIIYDNAMAKFAKLRNDFVYILVRQVLENVFADQQIGGWQASV